MATARKISGSIPSALLSSVPKLGDAVDDEAPTALHATCAPPRPETGRPAPAKRSNVHALLGRKPLAPRPAAKLTVQSEERSSITEVLNDVDFLDDTEASEALPTTKMETLDIESLPPTLPRPGKQVAATPSAGAASLGMRGLIFVATLFVFAGYLTFAIFGWGRAHSTKLRAHSLAMLASLRLEWQRASLHAARTTRARTGPGASS